MIQRIFTRHLLKPSRPIKSAINTVDYAVCIDLESTCDSPIQIYPMEVIEFACVKVDLRHKPEINESIDEPSKFKTIIEESRMFHKHVKPTINPKLTLFCQDLTGIMQTTIEESQTIDKVVIELMNWLRLENLIDDKFNEKERFAFASCGNFDLHMLSPIIKDCQFKSKVELLPIYFKEWINVKKTFVNHKREWPKGLYHMMELLGEEPKGRLHSAKDDCLNLARVIECLHLEGCKFHITNRVK